MSGGESADPPPPQRPNGGEFLLSLLHNPTNARHRHRRPPHPHGDNSFNNNPPSAEHLPFPVHPIPLDPAVAAVSPAIVPSDVHDRLSPPWPPHGLSPPSQRPSPHLIYPHSFASRPIVPNPNDQFVHAGGDLRRGDLGGTGFVDIRLLHQFQKRDLSVGSLGFSPADSISSGSLGFDITGNHQVRSLGAHHDDRMGRYQESWNLYSQGISSMNKDVSPPPGYLHQNDVVSRDREKQNYGNVHGMMSAVAVDRMSGGKGEREFGDRRIGIGFEGAGDKRGTRSRNRNRESSGEDRMLGNGSGDVHLSQQLDLPGLPAGSMVRSVSPARAEEFQLGREVAEDGSVRGNEGREGKDGGLDDLEERLNGIVVGEDGVD